MATTFNSLLVEAGLDPHDVRLLRHADPRSAPGRTPYHLWHDDRAKFDRYQSSQHKDERTRAKLKSKYWASFVGTPEGGTLFVGLYEVRSRGLLLKDEPAPHRDGVDAAGSLDEYELVLDERLRDRIGRMYVDWGKTGKRTWIQRADQQDKLIDDGGGARPASESAPSYVARICWNSQTWTRPTGEAARLEAKGSYAADKGFGHEEWLFDREAALDGWQYGFLQAVNKSYRKVVGRTIDLRLWTMGPGATRYYVGRIPACEVLTPHEAEAAAKQFGESGRLAEMEAQVRAVGGKPDDLRTGGLNVANVRFRADAAVIQDPLVPAAEGHAIRDLNRYTLVGSGDRWQRVLQEWPATGRRPALPPSERRQGAFGTTWLKTIGFGDRPRIEAWTRPQVHFTERMPGTGIRVGHILVLYAAGQHPDGQRPIFAVAEVTSPVRPNEVDGKAVEGEDPFICDVRYLVNLPTASGVPLATINPDKDFRSSRQKSYIRLTPEEAAAAYAALLQAAEATGSGTVLPEELASGRTYREGAAETVLVNAYERDRRCRVACLAHYGPACFICGMTFGDVYGAEFAGRIHVHHLDPVSTLGGGREVDPVKDLRPICPNCHYVAHLRIPPHTPEEIRAFLKRAR